MSDEHSGFPTNDRMIELPSGKGIRFYNLIIVLPMVPQRHEPPSEGSSEVHLTPKPGRTFGVSYDTSIPRSDTDARRAEALEVVELFAARESCADAYAASAQICSTPAQAAMEERPEQVFAFEREDDGSWTFREWED